MRNEERIGLRRFLESYPGMRIRPSPSDMLRLEGEFEFRADSTDGPTIEDTYRLRIDVPHQFPNELPKILELDGRIPHHIDYHVYPKSGELCLGSPFRLYVIARKVQDFTKFVQRSIIPYLYAASYRERTGGPYPFGELAHGRAGLLDDYAQLLGLNSSEQAAKVLALLAMKRRLANKWPCPCGCGHRLGVCSFNVTVRRLRTQFGRPFFKRLNKGVQRN